MANLEKIPSLLLKAQAEWGKQEILKKGKTSIRNFANYLGYSKATINFWMNKKRKISERALQEILPKLHKLLGDEIYKELEIEKPNPYKTYIIENFEKLSKEKQTQIYEIVKEEINKKEK